MVRSTDHLFKYAVDTCHVADNGDETAMVGGLDTGIYSLPKILVHNLKFGTYLSNKNLDRLLDAYPMTVRKLDIFLMSGYGSRIAENVTQLFAYIPRLTQLVYLCVNAVLRPLHIYLLPNLKELNCQFGNISDPDTVASFRVINRMKTIKKLVITGALNAPFKVNRGDSLAELRSIPHVDIRFESIKTIERDSTDFERSLDGIEHLRVHVYNVQHTVDENQIRIRNQIEFRNHKCVTYIDQIPWFRNVDIRFTDVDLLRFVYTDTPEVDSEEDSDGEGSDGEGPGVAIHTSEFKKPRHFWDMGSAFHAITY
jgi:hypothetical protein